MSEGTPSPTKQSLAQVAKFECTAETRDHLYQRISMTTGLSETSIPAAASTTGLTSSSRSLRCILLEEEEDALVQV